MRIKAMITQDEFYWFFKIFSHLLPKEVYRGTNENLNFLISGYDIKGQEAESFPVYRTSNSVLTTSPKGPRQREFFIF